MLIVFIGPPGAGKGTQSQRLVQYLGVPHLSTGDMLRAAKQSDDEVGRMIAQRIDSGHLVPDDLVIALVGKRLAAADCARGCLLDGFPRTVHQAKQFDQFLAGRGEQLDLAIEMRAEKDELVRRMLHRARREGRQDDTPETIDRRINVYLLETTPVLDYYRDRGVLHTIDALGTPDEVFDRMVQVVDRKRIANGELPPQD